MRSPITCYLSGMDPKEKSEPDDGEQAGIGNWEELNKETIEDQKPRDMLGGFDELNKDTIEDMKPVDASVGDSDTDSDD